MYIKIAESVSPASPAKIVFYYNRDTLFKTVSLMSNFMAKNLRTKDGVSLTDDYSISDDEKDLFGVCVQKALPDIYESMAKITNQVIPAFGDNVTEDGTTTGTDITGAARSIAAGQYIEFVLLDNNAYNANVITLVDASLDNALASGVLKEFYSTVVQAELLQVSATRSAAELLKLEKRLFQLKKKSVVSNIG